MQGAHVSVRIIANFIIRHVRRRIPVFNFPVKKKKKYSTAVNIGIRKFAEKPYSKADGSRLKFFVETIENDVYHNERRKTFTVDFERYTFIF